MTIQALDRRTVLRGMLATGAAVTIPLPLLEIMLNQNGTALAQTGTPVSPLYVTWFFGNGTLPGKWKPASTGAGSAWALSPQLQPLAAFKSHLTVISGLENKLHVSGMEHPTGSAGATTGAPLNGNAVRAPSIDQIVANAIATGADYRSIEVGVTPATPGGATHTLHTVAHSGPNARLNPEYDPRKVFQRLFMGSTQPPPTTPQRSKPPSSRGSERVFSTPFCKTAQASSSGSASPMGSAWRPTSSRSVPLNGASTRCRPGIRSHQRAAPWRCRPWARTLRTKRLPP